MQCSSGLDCLGKHIHCGANSGSSFGLKFELTTCEFVFVHTSTYIDGLAAIGDVPPYSAYSWDCGGWTDAIQRRPPPLKAG